MCCDSPRARARREARRAAQIAFAKKVFQVVTGNRYEGHNFTSEKFNTGSDIGSFKNVQHNPVQEKLSQQRPQMYARSLAETQLPSYDEVVEKSAGFKDGERKKYNEEKTYV